jgi:hypothetical protein
VVEEELEVEVGVILSNAIMSPDFLMFLLLQYL